MALNPSTPTRRPANRRGTNSTPARRPTLADAFHGRSTTRRRNSNDLNDRAAVTAELRRETTKLNRQSTQADKPAESAASNSVQDRIRKWQSQGGGVVEQPVPAIFSPEATPAVSEVSTEKDKSDYIELGDTANRRRKRRSKEVEAEVEAEDEVKIEEKPGRAESKSSSNAPKKRVVSDSAWQKRGSSNRNTRKATPNKEIRVGDGNRRTPSRGESARKGRFNKDVPVDVSKKDSDGIRVYGKSVKDTENLKPEAPNDYQRRSSGSRSGQTSEEDRPSSRTTPTPPRKTASGRKRPENRKGSFTMSGALGEGDLPKRRRPSDQVKKAAERSPRSSLGANSEEKPKRRASVAKTSILKEVYGEGKRIFSKNEPPPPPQVPGNRIEAWLSGTPDPFVDTPPSQAVQSPPVPPIIRRSKDLPNLHEDQNDHRVSPSGSMNKTPRKRDSRDRRTSKKLSPPRESENTYRDDTQRRLSPEVEKRKSPKDHNVVADAPSLSSPTLKRTGARRGTISPTRRKDRSATPEKTTLERSRPNSGRDSGHGSSASAEDVDRTPKPRRVIPTNGGHDLSTIASAETLSTATRTETPLTDINDSTGKKFSNLSEADHVASETQDSFDPDHIPNLGKKTSLKRRLTTHADLISVLSLPRAGSKSIRSARSIRTNRSRIGTATIEDLMQELATDESKYMRELNTLVDGVIPVLLTCVLSKSDSAIAAGLFSSSADPNDPNVTRPIVDMGIALERLKSLHKKVPLQSADQVTSWAHRGHKAYSDYIKCYRMGFQDVVVNLAPANEGAVDGSKNSGLDEGLPRNAEGDIVNGDGERVDVAFLLKRPLVRLKYLAKTLKGIDHVKPSPLGGEVSTRFQTLVSDARRRSSEEKARLEDEAAANIDPTRARDFRTLAPLSNASIDRARRVKARDIFSLSLQHSSGQRVDCKVELILRDDPKDLNAEGDLLVCEVDGTGRWLLFPPASTGKLSARNGDQKGEMMVMVRGTHGLDEDWQELLVLHSDEEQAGFEWVQMLGLIPVPPGIVRQSSFISKPKRLPAPPTTPSSSSKDKTLDKSRTPSPREIEVPIGEHASCVGKPNLHQDSDVPQKDYLPQDAPHRKEPSTPTGDQFGLADGVSPSPRSKDARGSGGPRLPSSLNEAMADSGQRSDSGLRRQRAHRRSRHIEEPPSSPVSKLTGLFGNLLKGSSPKSPPSQPQGTPSQGRDSEHYSSPSKARENRTHSDSEVPRDSSTVEREVYVDDSKAPSTSPPETFRPPLHQRTSSVPTEELPTIQKLRKGPPKTPSKTSPEQNDVSRDFEEPSPEVTGSPTKLKKRSPLSQDKVKAPGAEGPQTPPAPPPHRSSSPAPLKVKKTPKLKPSASATDDLKSRRSSSPLKHQYEPSSESDSASEDSYSEHDDDASFSSSSDEEDLEGGDVPTPLLPVGALHRFTRSSPKGSIYSMPNGTIAPSQSASQAPYKQVPSQPMKASKTIATIYSWSDAGRWDQMHPDECSIVITPGLIEAYEMSAEHSRPVSDDAEAELASPSQQTGERPLVGLELTPLVPLRRGTALDISIRSPPTANSQLSTGNNVMFRSRNPEECEALYALINTARINNPTYIALQNARGPYGDGIGSGMDRRGPRSRSSWFGLGRRNSYRASSNRASSVAISESSVGSLSSAFSALKRFGNNGRSFNISKSTVGSREGSRAASVYSSSSNSSLARGGTETTPDISKGSPMGLTNAKIRLYQRETASKWRDMGSARLSITRPPEGFDRYGLVGNEKRILVNGKTADEVLLDVCLGESCFERVARTGIALSVWEEIVGPNGEIGQVGAVGGVGGKTKVYMIQVSDSPSHTVMKRLLTL
ncbi:MAG: hypothetical protein M4579_001666 [Chaenotheca gracillima]|nr:MAG: hypothetical protein M4579_001666 [Chaenotheca gracillima]